MPRKAARLIGVSLLGLAGVFIVVAAAGLGFRAYRQHLAAETLAIRSPAGVQEGEFVDIGGIKQWVQIRGEDRDNPVLLFVHGGPGGTTLPISSGWRPWEKHFTVVQWDQRGAGRTYGAAGDTLGPTMTLERMTQDGVELAEYLRIHLHKDKIVLVGHSWGSFLGIHIVKQRPDLFYAYVGTGQVVGRVTFEKQFEITISHASVGAVRWQQRGPSGIGANRRATSDQSTKSTGCGQVEQGSGATLHRERPVGGSRPTPVHAGFLAAGLVQLASRHGLLRKISARTRGPHV
jgi:pimeloyl-ACP methyl ester carboxylesterase